MSKHTSKLKKKGPPLRPNQLPLRPSNKVLQEFDKQGYNLGTSMYGPDLLQKAYSNNIQTVKARNRKSVGQMTSADRKRKANKNYAKLTRKKHFNSLPTINEENESSEVNEESNRNNNNDFSNFNNVVTHTSTGPLAQNNLHHAVAAAAATKPRKLPWQYVQEFENAQAASAAGPKNRSRKKNSNNEFVMVKHPTIILNSIKKNKMPTTFDLTIDRIKRLLELGDKPEALRIIKTIYNAKSKNNNEEQLKKELINTFVSGIATNQNLTRKIRTINKLK